MQIVITLSTKKQVFACWENCPLKDCRFIFSILIATVRLCV